MGSTQPRWSQRKQRLNLLLNSEGDEDADAISLDRLIHGQNIIGKTTKTTEIDALKFQEKDLKTIGTLDRGQFGVIDVVRCVFDDRLYIKKITDKVLALRTQGQCSPQHERDILLRARKTNSEWVPHLLCAFQTPASLNLVMDYAEGGSMWDVLESQPDGRVSEADMRWWVPQLVSAVAWCHEQGYAHRDIKPHNFVLTANARIRLIDFGSASTLLPPRSDGSRALPRRACLVPCGTCDYISPEILRFHEDALVALEMEEENCLDQSHGSEEGYGLETDWWSLGAMMYELFYGTAPFFAQDIRQTYTRILAHHHNLRFDPSVPVSPNAKDLLSRLLTNAEQRIGRRGSKDILRHPYFRDIPLGSLSSVQPPETLNLPQFVYADERPTMEEQPDESHSQPFAFSMFFQSSPVSERPSASPGLVDSMRRSVSSTTNTSTSFIGFSWGPPMNAFAELQQQQGTSATSLAAPISFTPRPLLAPQSSARYLTPGANSLPFATPIRSGGLLPFATLPRGSTVRRSATVRRAVSDREAMKELVNCIGMSARKKVLESGKKPRLLPAFNRSGTLKELRFFPEPIIAPNYDQTSSPERPINVVNGSDDGTVTESDGPPSPSPRPGSAMSFVSKRSGTPTITTTFSQRLSGSSFLSVPRSAGRARSVSTTSSTRSENELSLSFDDKTLADVDARLAALIEDIVTIEERIQSLVAVTT